MHFEVPPEQIKCIQHFMKLAEDHDERNKVVSYYARMAAIQMAMKVVPGAKPPEVSAYLIKIMDWLEKSKGENSSVEGIANETVAQAIIEEYMLKLYDFAYNSDCAGTFNKNVVKSYYTGSLLCDVLIQFGPLSEDMKEKSDTCKYRAAYIHNMLKQGMEPIPINNTILETEEEEQKSGLTIEELNERRIARGEEPLPLGFNTPQAEPDDLALPTPPQDEEERPKPVTLPYKPVVQNVPSKPAISSSGSFADLSPGQNEKAIKYCKWASSALTYDDVKTAISNLEKALHLCRTGAELE